MAGIDFEYKKINDPIHGMIGLSATEHKIIQSQVFARLSRLYQLGLSFFVFPGATHTRFAHSIGTMHVLYQMITAINKQAVRCNSRKIIEDDGEIQKLRLAALLHDIGHYPLGHSSEWVFYRSENDKRRPEFDEPIDSNQFAPLNEMAKTQKSKKVSHEAFGEKILNHCEEISTILKSEKYDPLEICSIFLGENPKKWIYSQLIHSSLDADRLDYLLRDSHYAGISYGHIDLDFILTNLRYDKEEDLFAIDYKGITTFEHFLIARYFLYHNMTYHKSVMGFELVAKALYYEMAKNGHVIGEFDQLVDKLSKEPIFLKYFDDSYFWTKLKEWTPTSAQDDYYRRLQNFLLMRRKPEVIIEERRLVRADKDCANNEFDLLRDGLFDDSMKFDKICIEYGVTKKCFAVTENKIEFEEQPPLTRRNQQTPENKKKQLGHVYESGKFRDLLDVEFSIVSTLSQYRQHIRRLIFFNLYDIDIDPEEFRNKLTKS